MSITLQFCGAAETVSGSRHLLTVDGRRYLIDCGLFQGDEELQNRNWDPFPIPAHELSEIILTHAHIDHIGYLPRMIKQGYQGSVHCTSGTADIVKLSLPDSGHLQEEHARYANKKGYSKHKPALPLYTEKDANEACKKLVIHDFDKILDLGKGCKLRFLRAGHILGSAFVEFWLPDGRMILFGGDLGRPNQPIIRDPEFVDAADFLLLESTYGDREHSTESPKKALLRLITEVTASGGMLIIPSFAIGRTQDVLYYLRELEAEGECPVLPVYVDSPMAVDATAIYARHHEDHDLDMEALESTNDSPLRSQIVNFVRSVDQSKALNQQDGPGIIIASSGMANGGRVVHHLSNRLPDDRNIVLFVGFQAVGTLGRRLVEGAPTVRMIGREVDVAAKVEMIGSLSAHADRSEILDWLAGFKIAPKRTFIVHGEPEPQAALKTEIEKRFNWNCYIPKYLEIVEL